MAKTICATGATKSEAREKLNSELIRRAGAVKPQGGLKIAKNANGTYTASVRIIESR